MNSNEATEDDTVRLPPVEVSAIAPLRHPFVSIERVAGNVQLIDPEAFEGQQPLGLNHMLNEQVGSITVTDAQNNPLQPQLAYRGFTVSPLLGLPQGIAVYQDGTRINEGFGDTVNFDLVPEFAIQRVMLVPGSNPVYGLNALGGAISLDMKSGFDSPGSRFELSGGSFGRTRATVEHGARNNGQAFYIGATHFKENGWRAYSTSELSQVHADVRIRPPGIEVGVSLTLANSDLNGNGAVPADLLAVDRRAVFTWPDNTRNRLAFLQLHGERKLSDSLALQANAYVRDLHRDTANGDETDIEECEPDPQWLCGDDGSGERVVDASGSNIATGSVGEDPFALFNRTGTETLGFGASLQVTWRDPGIALGNLFIAGLTFDEAGTRFNNSAEIGSLTESRTVAPAGISLGGADFNTRLDSTSRHRSVYFTNMVALRETLDLSASGRFNQSQVLLDDQMGMALDGRHEYSRFNPAVGVTWQASEAVTAYVSYSESNRVPTPAELACADPDTPCRFPHAFVADPPLEQVAARTVELGLRGGARRPGASVEWFLSPFITLNDDDILFVSAGPAVGSGYFRNAGETQRLGLEAGVRQDVTDFSWFMSYAFVRATFEDSHRFLAEHNPYADASGEVLVEPGDRMPNLPEHSFKVGLDWDVTPRWRLGMNAVLASDRFLLGDEGNAAGQLDGFAVLDADATWQLADGVDLFVRIENLLDAEYETFGTFGEPTEVPLGELDQPATDPRFLGPGAPRGAWVGLRIATGQW